MPFKDRDKQREFCRFWMEKRRHLWFLANGPCKHCGSWDDMELDHIEPATKASHRIWSWREDKREAELKKCQVLCHACHQAKTIAELKKPLVHGTDNGYRKHGCRCDACRAANARRQREIRARKEAA